VVITDAIPANTSFIPGSASGTGVTIEYSHNGGAIYDTSSALPVMHIRFTRASLPAVTTNQTVSFRARVDPGVADQTVIGNTATLQADNVAPITSNRVTTTAQEPFLTLNKAVDKAQARPGEVLTYTLTYTNTGSGTAHNMQFLDIIPANTQYVAGSASGTGATIQFQHVNGGTFDSSDAAPVTAVKWTIPGPIAPGATGTLRFQVRIR
jgi:uncharacterized repeat protein (TIGR01451 family)